MACSYLHVPGGYEKAMITTANLFAEKGHKVTLLILDYTAETYYPVNPNVSIVHRPMNFGISAKGNTITRKIRLWKDIRKLKKLLQELKPGYIICSEYPFAVAAILGGAKKIAKVFSWEHHHFKAQQLNRFWQFLYNRTYKKLNAIICLNKEEQEYYLSINDNAVVIPNFIAPQIKSNVSDSDKECTLLSVTRFNHIKGIDLMMAAAKIVLTTDPAIKWKVIGYGEQKDTLLDFIKRENLTGRLIYQSADKTDLTADYKSAGIFVMTSRNECFPLVLLEAMSNGLPCIAFDCDTGPRHIIHHNQTGFLIAKENVQELANAISTLVNDQQRQKSMSEKAINAVQSFYPDKVYELWKQLFSNGS